MAAQTFGVGVKAGARLTNDLTRGSAESESKRYVVGPVVSARLSYRFSVEAGALYQRVGYRAVVSVVTPTRHLEHVRGNSWEFPILARRTLWRGIYAGAGYAPRVIHGNGRGISITTVGSFVGYRDYDVPGRWETTHGVVWVAGIEKRIKRFRLAPEIRQVYWNKPAIAFFPRRGSLESTQYQVDLLFGISFP